MSATTSIRTDLKSAPVMLGYGSFVLLGLQSGLLSVAWPSIQKTFARPLDGLGVILLISNLGYLVTSFFCGRIVARLGLRRLLVASALVRALAFLGHALAPRWWLFLLAVLAEGASGAGLDAGLNASFAVNCNSRQTNWLHAFFGVGTTFGPLVMTAVLQLDHSWRWGYLPVILLQFALAWLLLRSSEQWHVTHKDNDLEPPASPGRATLKQPLLWLGMMLFFIYAGTEVTAGQWSYTILTQSRAIAPGTAGLWVSIYWGTFTVGRFLFGMVAQHISLSNLLRVSMLSAVGGTLLFAWPGPTLFSLLGLGLTGLALAPIFPLLISDTPRRLGANHAVNAVGFQISAAGTGIAILPWLAGRLAEGISLDLIGPFLLICTLIMLVLGLVNTWSGSTVR